MWVSFFSKTERSLWKLSSSFSAPLPPSASVIAGSPELDPTLPGWSPHAQHQGGVTLQPWLGPGQCSQQAQVCAASRVHCWLTLHCHSPSTTEHLPPSCFPRSCLQLVLLHALPLVEFSGAFFPARFSSLTKSLSSSSALLSSLQFDGIRNLLSAFWSVTHTMNPRILRVGRDLWDYPVPP